MKFDYKVLQKCIAYLDNEIYLHNVKLHTKVYRKETDRQHYLHVKSDRPMSLKDSLPYSQAMLIKRISSNQLDSNNSLKELKQLRKTRAPFTTNQRTPFKDRFTGQD